MLQNELKPPIGAKHSRKRVGRGNGSGHGSFSGRGCKGHKSRAGGGVRLGFEGGQLPLIERLPRKRGFTNIHRAKYNIINVGQLNSLDANTEITLEVLCKAGIVKSNKYPVKILADGDITKPLIIKAGKISAAAEKKIVAAGGKVEVS
jgi:large subunit ribosomal protein L15